MFFKFSLKDPYASMETEFSSLHLYPFKSPLASSFVVFFLLNFFDCS